MIAAFFALAGGVRPGIAQPLVAGESPSAPAVARVDTTSRPGHAVYVSVSDGWFISPARFPASYLTRASGRQVVAPADLNDGQLLSLEMGVPLSERLVIEGEASLLDGDVDARTRGTRIGIDMNVEVYGARALWWLGGQSYLAAGAGAIRFNPSPGPADTEVQGSVGLGLWPRFAGGHVRVELRGYLSDFSPTGVPDRDQGVRSDVALISAVVFGIG